MKKNSLFIKILVILFVLIVLINVVSVTIVSAGIKKEISDRLLSDAMLVLHSLDWAFSPMIEDKQNTAIQRLIENIGASDLAKSIKIVGLDTSVVFTNSTYDLSKDEHIVIREILEFHKLHFLMRNDDNQLLVAVPIRGQYYDSTQAGNIQAALILSIDEKYEAKLVRELRHNFIILDIFTTKVLIGITAIVLYILVAKPLKQFREGIKHVANRDYGHKIDIKLNGEFRELADSYNNMIEKISSHTEELTDSKQLAETSTFSKSQFISKISHELLTPITSVIGFNDLLIENESDGSKLGKLNAINDSSNTLLRLVNDLLDISKFEMKTFLLENEPLKLIETLDMIYECYEGVATEKNIAFKMQLHESLPKTVLGDQKRLVQLMNNLLNNAFKFTNSGYIRVNVTYQNSVLEIRVTDTGVGIEEDKLDNIFDAFVQSDNSLSRKYGGTGLGLAISKKIVLAMNGTIVVSSQLHEGSTFVVKIVLPEINHSDKNMLISNNPEYAVLVRSFTNRLPKIFKEIDQHIAQENMILIRDKIHLMKGTAGNLEMNSFFKQLSELELHKELDKSFKKSYVTLKSIVSQYKVEPLEIISSTKVLIIDNDFDMRHFIDYFVEKEDVEMTLVTSGLEALEKIFAASYDVIIMNPDLKDMSDVELFELLKHSHLTPYIIGLVANESDIKERLDQNYNWFITKPVNRYLVEAKINELRRSNE